MIKFKDIFRQSGGLWWHLRAVTSGRRYQPFKAQIAHWLERWGVQGPGLILVGPSAGWCLQSTFLGRFERITVFELDPLAQWLFKLRHARGLTLDWRLADFLSALPATLQEYPDDVVLFANVLGQLGFERPKDYELQLSQLKNLLVGRHWGSFHDRFSAEVSPSTLPSVYSFKANATMTAESLHALGFSGTWQDHGTAEVFPTYLEREYFPWWITPQRLQWIEAAWMPAKIV